MNPSELIVSIVSLLLTSVVSIYGTLKVSQRNKDKQRSSEFDNIIEANRSFREEIRIDLKLAREEIIELKKELESARISIRQLNRDLEEAKHIIESLRVELNVKEGIIRKLSTT